jgi:cell division protein ZipA
MMQANWSLVLNVLLLIGVVFAIGRMMKAKRRNSNSMDYQPSVAKTDRPSQDEIIAVRKINTEPEDEAFDAHPPLRPNAQARQPTSQKNQPSLAVAASAEEKKPAFEVDASSIVVFLLAKENRQLAGYELLQTVLAAGLRFGQGHLFHRHQHTNGQGPILCSLAAATPTGVFDMQNIGAFSVHGLCLFMHPSGNPTIDAERFTILLETARQLSDELGTHLLDDQRQPLSNASIQRYQRMLNVDESTVQSVAFS